MSSPRLASLSGLAALALLVGAVAAYAAVGTVDGAPAAAWADALKERGRFAQGSGYLHALAGLCVAAFAWTLHGASSRNGGPGLPAWARFAAFAWSGLFVLAGTALFASVELADYQAHPEGAKTALVLGHLLYANPIAGLLGAGFALGVGVAVLPGWPAWFRPFSLGAGGLGAAVTLLGGIGGIGLLGLGPVAVWFLAASAVAPWQAWRAKP